MLRVFVTKRFGVDDFEAGVSNSLGGGAGWVHYREDGWFVFSLNGGRYIDGCFAM